MKKASDGDIILLHDTKKETVEAVLRAIPELQEQGYDTVDANLHLGYDSDERDYGVGAQILNLIGVRKMRLMTNNPVKRVGLEAYGLEIVESIPIETTPNPFNETYLRTKQERMGHALHLKK